MLQPISTDSYLTGKREEETYKAPRLMEAITPIFSRLFITRSLIVYQARRERAKSIADEYA